MMGFLRASVGAALIIATFGGCSGGGRSTAPEGAGVEGDSDPGLMAEPPPAEISPDDGGEPAAETPSTTP